MARESLILIVFLTVCCLMSVSFQINHIERVSERLDGKIQISQKGASEQRLMQAVSVDGNAVNSVASEILLVLNDMRKESSQSELGMNSTDQQILNRWQRIFRQTYTLKEYLERLGKFSGSRILEFSGLSSKQKLLRAIQQASLQWILVERLKQVGILVEMKEDKYYAIILVKQFNQGSTEIQTKTYGEMETKTIELMPNLVVPIVVTQQATAKNNSTQSNQAQQKNTQPVKPIAQIQTQTSTNSSTSSNSTPSSPTLITPTPSSNLQSPQTISPQPKPIPFLPLPALTIPSSAIQQNIKQNPIFKSIILYHDLPTTFLNTENFLLKGRLLSPPPTDQGITIWIIFNLQNTNQFTQFTGWVPKGQTQFHILLQMNKLNQGKYFLSARVNRSFNTAGIYTVRSGKSSLRTQMENAPLAPVNLSVSLNGNEIYCNWNQNDRNALVKVTFQQISNKKRQYILSNFPSKFQVPYKDFYDFTQGPVTVSVSSAYSSSLSEAGRLSEYSTTTSINFKAIQHHFNQTRDQQIQLNSEIPFRIKVNDSITISGKALTQLGNKIYVLQPGYTFAEYYFNQQNKSEIIQIGRVLSKRITFTQEGVYIIEVNNAPGSAVINQPIYVGEGYPLLPDFQDLRPQPRPNNQVAATQPATLAEKRQLMLKLINQKRAEFGAKPILSDPQLDRLAQMHSDDMVARNFFGHVNPSKETPQDRATRIGIKQGVSQNIATNNNVTDGHQSLCRSNAHLMNIVNKEWEKVGLGFAWDSGYTLFISQAFAGRDYFKFPLTEEEIKVYKDEMISYIKELYPTVKSQNTNLSSGLSQWQNLSVSSQNSQSIMSFLRSKGLRNFSIGNIRVYYAQNFIDNMKATGYLQSDKPNPTEVGIGMKMDNGWLEIFIAYI